MLRSYQNVLLHIAKDNYWHYKDKRRLNSLESSRCLTSIEIWSRAEYFPTQNNVINTMSFFVKYKRLLLRYLSVQLPVDWTTQSEWHKTVNIKNCETSNYSLSDAL